MEKKTVSQNQVLGILAWVCAILGAFVLDIFSLIGIVLGHYHWENGGSRAPFWTNLGVLAFSFIVGFIYGFVNAL